MSKASIITTTYNHKDFIAQTIESILAQTRSDRELLIGDDSPDDATWNIIQTYVQKYPDKIKARRHRPNKGIVENMNFLIDHISQESKYVAFLEGDDLYTSNHLERKLKILQQYPAVKLVYNDISMVNHEGIIFSKKHLKRYIIGERIDINDFIKGDIFYASYSSLFCEKDSLLSIGIRDLGISGNIISDWDFFGRFAMKYPIYGIAESLTLYRRHDGGLTRSFVGKEKLINQLETCVLRLSQEFSVEQEVLYYFLAKKYTRQACNNIFMSQQQEARKNLKKAFGYGFFVKFYLKIAAGFCVLLPTVIYQGLISLFRKLFPSKRRKLLGG